MSVELCFLGWKYRWKITDILNFVMGWGGERGRGGKRERERGNRMISTKGKRNSLDYGHYGDQLMNSTYKHTYIHLASYSHWIANSAFFSICKIILINLIFSFDILKEWSIDQFFNNANEHNSSSDHQYTNKQHVNHRKVAKYPVHVFYCRGSTSRLTQSLHKHARHLNLFKMLRFQTFSDFP